MPNIPADSAIRVSLSDDVARIFLARPASRNALNDYAWQTLAEICAELSMNASIRAVVLAADGEHFCAGADIHEIRSRIQDADWMRTNQLHVAAGIDAWAALPQPTIAVIRGSCFGGGTALAVGADFRIASNTARFAVTPARLGLTYRLIDCLRISQLIGPARTRELLLLAREIDAATAATWGLVTRIIDDADLPATLEGMLTEIVALSGYSQRGIKTSLLKIRDGTVADDDETRRIFAAAFNAPDFRAAADAFAAKSSNRSE